MALGTSIGMDVLNMKELEYQKTTARQTYRNHIPKVPALEVSYNYSQS